MGIPPFAALGMLTGVREAHAILRVAVRSANGRIVVQA
jgi:hypothetical protein